MHREITEVIFWDTILNQHTINDKICMEFFNASLINCIIFLLTLYLISVNIINVNGRLAQLGERLPYKQDVGGSIPSSPTNIAAIAQ